jgi:hypothetical protein
LSLAARGFQRKQIKLVIEAVLGVRAGDDLAQSVGKELGAGEILLRALP